MWPELLSAQQLPPAYIVLNGLWQSYPEQIDRPDYDNKQKDWFIVVNGKRFYWAEGRLLPLSIAQQYSQYKRFSLYYYPQQRPPVPPFSAAEEKHFLAEQRQNWKSAQRKESDAFRQALYRANSKSQMKQQIRHLHFLDFHVSVHPLIVKPLKRAERRLQIAMKQDASLQRFFATIKEISTYSWRRVRYFGKLSNHSFGTALDLLPYDWQGKAAYWNWERDFREDWFNVPHKQRWSPPQKVIDAFEAEGFIWGGKWLYFDMMHFEYRPELYRLREFLRENHEAVQ